MPNTCTDLIIHHKEYLRKEYFSEISGYTDCYNIQRVHYLPKKVQNKDLKGLAGWIMENLLKMMMMVMMVMMAMVMMVVRVIIMVMMTSSFF